MDANSIVASKVMAIFNMSRLTGRFHSIIYQVFVHHKETSDCPLKMCSIDSSNIKNV